MSWMIYTLFYGVVKGGREIVKKKALEKSTVFEVLFFYTLFGFIFLLPTLPFVLRMTPLQYLLTAVKAFVMLKPGIPKSEKIKQEILDYCRKHVAKYAMPRDLEFRDELPKTLVGKVAYRVLEEEEAAKIAASKESSEAEKKES